MSNVEIVEKEKILSFVAILSNYDLFQITIDDWKQFKATGVECVLNGFLEFRRLFALSVFSDDVLIEIRAVSATEFICRTPTETYKIEALHKKPQTMKVGKLRHWNNVFDFMDTSYFGDRLNQYIKELDTVILVVDPYLLGELPRHQQERISHIINAQLDGRSKSMQLCRTICFQVRMNDDQNRIYAGVFDLENQNSITSRLIFDQSMVEILSGEYCQMCNEIREFSRKFYDRE